MALSELQSLADDLLYAMMVESPDLAAHMGVREVAGRPLPSDGVTDFSPAGSSRRDAVIDEAVARLTRIDRKRLPTNEQLTYDVVDYLVNEGFFWLYRGRAGRRFPEMLYPVNALEGVHPTLLELFVENHVFANPADVDAYLSRLESLPRAIAQGREALVERGGQNVIAPALILAQAIEGLRAFMTQPMRQNPLVSTLERGLKQIGVPDGRAEKMLGEAERSLAASLPAYDALIVEAERQAARNVDTVGLWRLPFGDVYYDWLLKAHTTTKLTPTEVHQLGLDELEHLVARCRVRFGEIGIKGGSIGDLYGQFQSEHSAYPDTAEGRRSALAFVEQTLAALDEMGKRQFDRLPKAPYRIEPVPAALEGSSHSRYTPPAADGTRPGTFIFNVKESTQRSRYELPILCYHEVMPGHHVQLALAQELKDLPALRRTVVFNAYIEGWAKYAETVPETSGAETDPRIALCRMKGELYSTVNLVLDTGIHAKRWSREKAKAFFIAQTGVPESFADMIVMRSLINPGQLTSYKIGMIKMMELKARVSSARGKSFRIQEFHDLVLKNGALPLSLLEQQVQSSLSA